MSHQILIIDDERNFREVLGEALEAEGFSVRLAPTARVGLALAGECRPDVVLLDQNLPDRSGLDLLPDLRQGGEGPPVIVLTAYAAFGLAVRAIKAGAFNYLVKPFEFSTLLECIGSACPGRYLPDGGAGAAELAEFMGDSLALRMIKAQIARIAVAPVNQVLVYGESGTGKELVARAIHRLSARAAAPLVSVNCAALMDTLLMSELFGHERGAFTDARERKTGLFEAAAGGTLFLDEVSEMGAQAQAALLRVLEQRTIRRVGGTREIAVDVRIVAATNRPLDEAVRDGRFRADLYYRLNVVQLSLPPLRERGDDVVRLAEEFCAMHAPRYRVPTPTLTAAAQRALRTYAWPGNVRELRNAIEHAFVSGVGAQLRVEDLPPQVTTRGTDPRQSTLDVDPELPFHVAKQQIIAQFERRYLSAALHRHAGNISRAAEDCGVMRQALQRLLARHQVDVSLYR